MPGACRLSPGRACTSGSRVSDSVATTVAGGPAVAQCRPSSDGSMALVFNLGEAIPLLTCSLKLFHGGVPLPHADRSMKVDFPYDVSSKLSASMSRRNSNARLVLSGPSQTSPLLGGYPARADAPQRSKAAELGLARSSAPQHMKAKAQMSSKMQIKIEAPVFVLACGSRGEYLFKKLGWWLSQLVCHWCGTPCRPTVCSVYPGLALPVYDGVSRQASRLCRGPQVCQSKLDPKHSNMHDM